MRVLVTGSRNWPSAEAIWNVLDIIADRATPTEARLYLRHGGCEEGGDLAAHVWASSHPRYANGPYVVEEIYRAAWAFGKGAGFSRNRRMVDDDPIDLCVAFISPCDKLGCGRPKPHASHGTTDCANYAESEGVTVWRYFS